MKAKKSRKKLKSKYIEVFTEHRPDRSDNFKEIDDLVVNKNIHERYMRPCQKEVYERFLHTQYLRVHAPGGCGKSGMIYFVAARLLAENPDWKVMILANETFNSKSFVGEETGLTLHYNNEDSLLWNIGNNLCRGKQNGKIKEIVNFVGKKKFPKGNHERALISTTSAFVQACDTIKDIEKSFEKTFILVDEYHHSQYENNGNIEVENLIFNKLGEVLNKVLVEENATTSLWLMTATPFRGDKLGIISEDFDEKFDTYSLPMDKYWKEDIKYIETFQDIIVPFNGNPWNEIKNIIKEKKKTIIFAPIIGNFMIEMYRRKLADNKTLKKVFMKKMISEIRKVWKDAKILDLVDEDGREEKKELLYDDEIAEDIDIIVTQRIFDEGSDWVCAEQAIDLVPSKSLRVHVQREYRLWRDYIGKKNLKYFMFFPFVIEGFDEEEYKNTLNNNSLIYMGCLLNREEIRPISSVMKEMREKKVGGEKKSKENDEPENGNPFNRQVPKDSKKQEILVEVRKDLLCLRGSEGKNIKKAQIKECIENTLKENGVEQEVEEVAKYIVKIFRYNIPNFGKDLAWMLEEGFNEIWDNGIFDSMLIFETEMSGIETFDRFNEVFRKSWDFMFGKVKEFVNENERFPSNHSENKEEEKLGNWISHQKQDYKKGILLKNRVNSLNLIKGWKWEEDKEGKWDKNKNQVEEFVNKNKRFPSNHSKNKEEKRLGSWINQQKINYKKNHLSEDRIKSLNSLSSWEWEDNKWNKTIIQVKEFVNEKKRFPYQKSENKEEKKLGSWIGTQRQKYKKSILLKNRVNLLNLIKGWKWEEDKKGKWDKTIIQVKEFVNEKKRFPSISSKNKEEKRLGNWISHQRQCYKKKEKRMTKERTKSLESIPCWKWSK